MARAQARGVCVVVLAAALVLAADNALDARQDDVRIHGRVVTESGAPVRGATVVLAMAPANVARTWTVSTDDAGVFEARGLPPGTYTLRVSKAGLLWSVSSLVTSPAPRQLGGALVGSGGSLMLELRDLKTGESKDAGVIVMRRGGAIAGRIVDGFGEPVMGAAVSASRITYLSPGSRSLTAAQTVATDDLGAYRIFGLDPGSYYVTVSVGSAGMSVYVEGGAVLRSSRESAPTFYPSGRSESEAQPVRVAVGEDRLGIDITIVNTPLSRVTGRLISSGGTPVPLAAVSLIPRGGGQSYLARTDPSGVFLFVDVAHGEYALLGSRGSLELAGQTGTLSAASPFESGLMPVTVGGDLVGIELRMARGFEIRGRLLIDGGAPGTRPDQRLMINVLADATDSTSHNQAAVVQPSGDFVFSSSAGRIRLSALGLPQGAMIARVSLNGIDVTDDGFEVSAPIGGLEIAVTTRPSILIGTVTAPGGERVQGGVIAFSENSRFWTLPNTRRVRAAAVAANGEFTIRGLPPGRYLAVAIGWLEPYTWADPLNLEELRKVATPFTMPESGTVTVNLIRR